MITICGVDELEEILASGEYDAVLSIEHPDARDGSGRAPRLSKPGQKILSFYDSDEYQRGGPTKELVAEAMEFLDAHRGDNVIIHCKAGISRSAALALGWIAKEMAQNGVSQEEAVEQSIAHIKAIRPIASPNNTVLSMIDTQYDFGGELSKTAFLDKKFRANDPFITSLRHAIEKTSFTAVALFHPLLQVLPYDDVLGMLYPEGGVPEHLKKPPSTKQDEGTHEQDSNPPPPSSGKPSPK